MCGGGISIGGGEKPVFDDLVAYGGRAIAWVRVYPLEDGGAIALAFNPADNPGPSVVNGAEALVDRLTRMFPAVEGLRVFTRFPGDSREKGWTELVFDEDRLEFERRAIEEVETLVGDRLVDPEEDAATCAALGGENHPLLVLIPRPQPERNPLDELTVVAVADLPWPHMPSRCTWKQRFEDLGELYGPDRECPAVGAHWSLTLDEADFKQCQYHQADWRRIADVSVEVLRGLPQNPQRGDVSAAIDQALGDTPEGRWCWTLFTVPIVWSPGQDSVTNGQHRACALRASGAPLCVVDAGGAHVAEPVAGDPRRRAAAEVAAHWARRTAE